MIPRFKPWLGKEELGALVKDVPDTLIRFENDFSAMLGATYGLAFPYGRSAQWAFFKALGIENSEIILSAYTCSVVAHAVVLSRNIPRFVDINLLDYNMNLDQVESAINPRISAITVTPFWRLPFFATFLVASGLHGFKRFYRAIRDSDRFLQFQFQFHLSDFVDYTHPDLVDQVPLDGQGVYVPKALRMPLKEKLDLFRVVMDIIASDYTFDTLERWAKELDIMSPIQSKREPR